MFLFCAAILQLLASTVSLVQQPCGPASGSPVQPCGPASGSLVQPCGPASGGLQQPCGGFITSLDCPGTILKYLRKQNTDMVAAAREEGSRILGTSEEQAEEQEEEWGPILGESEEKSAGCLEKYTSRENPNITLTCQEIRNVSGCYKFLNPDFRDAISWSLFGRVAVERYAARGCHFTSAGTVSVIVCAFTGLDKDDDDDDVTPTDDVTHYPTTTDEVTYYPTTTVEVTYYPTTTDDVTYYATTTEAPTTRGPTTKAPTTRAPTTKVPTTRAPTTPDWLTTCTHSINRHIGEQDADMVRIALEEGKSLIPNGRASCWKPYTKSDVTAPGDVTTPRHVTLVCKFLYSSRNAGSSDYDLCEQFLDPDRQDETSWSLYDRVELELAGTAARGCSYVLGRQRNVVVCAFSEGH